MTEVDFLPYPYGDSPPLPASSSLLRLVQSPGARRLHQWFQHHGQTAHASCLWSPFSPQGGWDCWSLHSAILGERGPQGSTWQPALSLPFLPHLSPLHLPLPLGVQGSLS